MTAATTRDVCAVANSSPPPRCYRRRVALEIIQVTDRITCLRRASYYTCSYVIRADRGIVLVDAGMKSDGSDVLEGLEAMGADITEVRAVLLTHWHNDHAAGAGEVRARSGATVCASAAEVPFLTRETASHGVLGWLSDAIPEAGPLVLAKGLLGSAPMRAVEVDRVVGEGDEIEGFRVIETPGHTDGHLSFWFEPERALFAGDALALIDDRLRFMARAVTPDLVASRASIARCLELAPSLVCPGHRHHGRCDAAELQRFGALVAGEEWPLLG
jgi:glyoxylase-like metal-dependent hydrolase (beta-lactamase superfamily II)